LLAGLAGWRRQRQNRIYRANSHIVERFNLGMQALLARLNIEEFVGNFTNRGASMLDLI
jgi:hypothetical protein